MPIANQKPTNLFDPAMRKRVLEDPTFKAAVAARARIIANSTPRDAFWPTANVPVSVALNGWTVQNIQDKKDARVTVGSTYILGFTVVEDASADGNQLGRKFNWYIRLYTPKPGSERTYDSNAKSLREFLRAGAPEMEDGSDPTDNEGSWPLILEDILQKCEAGYTYNLLPRESTREDSRGVVDEKTGKVKVYTDRELTKIREVAPVEEEAGDSDESQEVDVDELEAEEAPAPAPAPKKVVKKVR